jgi:hypothetical protein
MNLINDLQQRVKVLEVQSAEEKVRRLEAEARTAKFDNITLKSINKLGASVGGVSLDV